MIERLSVATFSPAVGETFAVHTESGEVPLRLVSVTPRERHAREGEDGWVPFSLMFLGPPDRFLDQRTHRLSHDATGPLEIFLVPVARDDTGFHYEAVFG